MTLVIRIVAIVTCKAGRALQRLCVAIPARGAAMIDASPTLISNAGMWTIVWRKPVVRCMAHCAIRAEHTGMESRVTVAAYAGS